MDVPVQARQSWVGVEQQRVDTNMVSQVNAPEAHASKSALQEQSLSNSSNLEWKPLLDTTMATLRDMEAARRTTSAAGDSSNGLKRVHRLHECLAALERMQVLLLEEFDRLAQVEQKASADQADLARVRAELVNVRIAARQAQHKSMHDELTSLPNRSCFLRRLDEELAAFDPAASTLALIFIDLDKFKSVNDANGHLIGDAFLNIVGSRLARIVRAEDTMSRFGGDEFTCLIKGADRDQLTRLAGKLDAVIRQPVTIDTLTFSVHPSIGISICKDRGTTANQLLSSADEAMYYAKKHQFGFAFYDSLTRGSESSAFPSVQAVISPAS